jgi:hypothetical protein
MKKEQINQFIETRKLSLTWQEKVRYYDLVSWFVLFPTVLLISFFVFYIQKNTFVPSFGNIAFLFAFYPAAVWLYKKQQKQLEFQVITTDLDTETLLEAVVEVAQENDWQTAEKGDSFVIFKTNQAYYSGNWTEKVTVLFRENTIFINSIADFHTPISSLITNRNQINIQLIIEKVSLTLPKKKLTEINDRPEPKQVYQQYGGLLTQGSRQMDRNR